MSARDVYATAANRTLGVFDRKSAAGTISEMSGIDANEIEQKLRGGVTIVCGGVTFTPEAALPWVLEERVAWPLAEVERAPFAAGRKA